MPQSYISPPDLSAGEIYIVAWSDPMIEKFGHDPRSTYVELFWLSVLGPSAVWLMRHMVRHLEASTDLSALPLSVDETAQAIGLSSSTGRNSSFAKTIDRLIRFGAARTVDTRTLGVRPHLPPLTRRQIDRLPKQLQYEHRMWGTDRRRPPVQAVSQQRARELALTLVQLGESADDAADQLRRWRIGEAAATAAAQWAWARELHPSSS